MQRRPMIGEGVVAAVDVWGVQVSEFVDSKTPRMDRVRLAVAAAEAAAGTQRTGHLVAAAAVANNNLQNCCWPHTVHVVAVDIAADLTDRIRLKWSTEPA